VAVVRLAAAVVVEAAAAGSRSIATKSTRESS